MPAVAAFKLVLQQAPNSYNSTKSFHFFSCQIISRFTCSTNHRHAWSVNFLQLRPS